MKYLRELAFDVKPNYKYLKQLFEALVKDNQFEDDGNFDWCLQKTKIMEDRAI